MGFSSSAGLSEGAIQYKGVCFLISEHRSPAIDITNANSCPFSLARLLSLSMLFGKALTVVTFS